MRMLLLMQISSATGTPQLTLPVAQVDGLPVGLSLLGPRNSDEILIALAQEMITCS
jgi:amidase